MCPLFFVHIPKTAGTSFRLGAENFFKGQQIVYDYGKDSGTTSNIVQKHLYNNEPDFWGFGNSCTNENAPMVSGHVNIGRFVSLFGITNTITFLRDPLQRMASEYAHVVRHYGYKGSFRDFYSRPVMHNRQSKILHGVSYESIGVIGLTERYSDSLELINARYGIEIPHREDNQGKTGLEAVHDLEEDEIAELKYLNQRDLALYEHSRRLFDSRLALFRDGLPYAHAHVVEATTQRVAGWAWWAGDNEAPVEVEVWINGELQGRVTATELRPGLCRLRVPRGGYIGFHLPVKLSAGDQIQCRVAHTKQAFPVRPLYAEEPKGK